MAGLSRSTMSGTPLITEQKLSRWKQFFTNHFPFEDRRISTFLLSWMSARCGEMIPLKSRILPENFLPLLPYIWIMKYIPEDDDFEVVLAGEKINQAHGGTIIGRRHRDVVGEKDSATLRAPIWEAHRERLVTYLTINTPLSQVEYYNGERSYVPLAADDGGPDFLLGMSLYTIMSSHLGHEVGETKERFTIRCTDLPN